MTLGGSASAGLATSSMRLARAASDRSRRLAPRLIRKSAPKHGAAPESRCAATVEPAEPSARLMRRSAR